MNNEIELKITPYLDILIYIDRLGEKGRELLF